MNGYEIYLMIELAKCHGLIEKDLEYDLAWDEGNKLYVEFTKSEFNIDTESEYDCIEKFLNKKVEELKYNLKHKSVEDELDLNIQALTASENGDMELSNTLWSLIELKGYKRLDYSMTLKEMIKLIRIS